MKDRGGGRKAPRTKTGCWTCRERKVRCDEKKPICSNCSRLGLACAGYGARITFRDDTPRVVQRMESVTDVQGCSVYDSICVDGKDSAGRHRLRYKTYTPDYFEKHREIEVETELLDISPQSGPSPKDYVDRSPSSQASYVGSRYPISPIPGNHGPTLGYGIQAPRPAEVQHWPSLPSPQRSPISPNVPLYNFSVPPNNQTGPLGGPYPGEVGSGYGYNAGDPGVIGNFEHQGHAGPQIVIDNHVEGPDRGEMARFEDGTPGSALLSPGSMISSHRRSFSDKARPAMPSPSLLMPPSGQSRSRRVTVSSETSDTRPGPSPSSLKWAEHFGGQGPSTPSSIVDADEVGGDCAVESLPQDLVDYVQTLVPSFGPDDERYFAHYYTTLAGQIIYPDRGLSNPFRILLLSLCPREPALLHAVLALSATDLAYNGPGVDSGRAFAQAQGHYDAALAILTAQLHDPRHEQSTAALATSYFLDLTDVKNARPISHTEALLRIVKARSAAGRIYEGGICWTWFNATLGVASALFGGPVLVMPYLIESDQLPTTGQGNMFPFIKKSEAERIEHTVISPMYISQLQTWVILSKLSVLANGQTDTEARAFESSVAGLRDELELSWHRRARLIDALNAETVEDVFRTKWKLGVPVAQQILTAYEATRLYTELLVRGSYPTERLRLSVAAILRIFDKICAAGEVFKRRSVLIPIFLCSVVAPDLATRGEVVDRLARIAGSEASWRKAAEVAGLLLRQDVTAGQRTGRVRWSEVRDLLGGIALF